VPPQDQHVEDDIVAAAAGGSVELFEFVGGQPAAGVG